jgi:tetratricopeptide (TPR) repeat protein
MKICLVKNLNYEIRIIISSGQTDIDIYRTVYIYQESKNYKQANLLYDSIINYYRHDHKAYFNRGVCRYNLAKYEDAVKDFETAIKLNANYTDAYLNKGLCFLKLNKIDSALNYFDWIVDNKPHYRNPGYRYKGIVHTIQGSYTKAKESYLNFLALDSTNAIAYFELGNLFLSNNGWIQVINATECKSFNFWAKISFGVL